MRVLGRYLFPLLIAFFVVSGFSFLSSQVKASHQPGEVINPELYADPNPGRVGQGVFFTGNVGGHSANDPPGQGDVYTYYFWQHCPAGPTGAGEAINYYDFGSQIPPGCNRWDVKRENVNALSWNIGSFTYSEPGNYNPVIMVRQYPNGPLYGNEIFFGPLVISDLQDDMDVTPDDGTPSGSKSSETNNGGPSGDSTTAIGATESYSASFTFGNSGNEAGYRFFMYDPAGNLRDPYPTSGYAQLSSNGQQITRPFTFNYGSGVYRVCAKGAQEEGLFVTGPGGQANAGNKLIGFISKLLGVAQADFTGVGATDQECKNVTVSTVKLEAETAPGSGIWRDDAVLIPYNTPTNLRWSSPGITSCTASNATPPKGNWSGSRTSPGNQTTGALTESTTYTINCGGTTDPVTVNVEGSPPPPPPPPPPPVGGGPTVDLLLNGQLGNVQGGQVQITQGTAGNLTWESTGAITSCVGWSSPIVSTWHNRIKQNDNPSPGESTGSLNQTTTFRITCTDTSNRQAVDEVTAYVERAANVRLYLNNVQGNVQISPGDRVEVKWEPLFSPTRCYVPSGWERGTWAGDKSILGGTETFFPTTETSFRLRCENGAGGNTVTRTAFVSDVWVKIWLNGLPGPGPVDVASGSNGTISWTTGPEVDECRANPTAPGWSGSKSKVSGSTNLGSLTSNQTYTIQCRQWDEISFFTGTCVASDPWTDSDCTYSSAYVDSNIVGATPLEVTLSARIGSGAYTTQDGGISGQVPLNGVGLKADVFTTGSGQLTYTFYCVDSGSSQPPIGPTSNISQVNDTPCDYATAGNKIAKVVVQKGTQTAEDTIQINVTTPPSDSPILTNPPTPGPFCDAGQYLSYDFTWTDQDQTAFEIDIDEDANFGSPFPSGKTTKTPAGGSHTYTPVVGTLGENTSYYWRVRTWDEFDVASNWTNGVRFTTWPYKGPRVRWVITEPQPQGSPPRYPIETQIVFDNTTIYYGGSNFTYLWEYDNEDPANAPANSTSENGNAIYTSIGDGNKRVRLTVTDLDEGESCFYQNRVNMGSGLDLPIFREIIPR